MKHDPEVTLFNSDLNRYISKRNVAINLRNETRYSTLIYNLVLQYFMYNTQERSLGETRLSAKPKEYILLYIPDKFQGVCDIILYII